MAAGKNFNVLLEEFGDINSGFASAFSSGLKGSEKSDFGIFLAATQIQKTLSSFVSNTEAQGLVLSDKASFVQDEILSIASRTLNASKTEAREIRKDLDSIFNLTSKLSGDERKSLEKMISSATKTLEKNSGLFSILKESGINTLPGFLTDKAVFAETFLPGSVGKFAGNIVRAKRSRKQKDAIRSERFNRTIQSSQPVPGGFPESSSPEFISSDIGDETGGMGSLTTIDNDLISIFSEIVEMRSLLASIEHEIVQSSMFGDSKSRENALELSRNKPSISQSQNTKDPVIKKKRSFILSMVAILTGALAAILISPVTILEGFLQFVGTYSKTFKSISTKYTAFVEGIGGLILKLVKPLGRFKILARFGVTFLKSFKFVSKFFRIFGKFMGPLGIIITVISSLFDGVKGFIRGFKEGGLLNGFREGFVAIIDGLIGSLISMFTGIIAWVANKLGFKDFAKSLTEGTKVFRENLGEVVRKAFDMIIFWPKHIISTIVGAFNLAKDLFTGKLSIGGLLKRIFGSFIGLIVDLLELIPGFLRPGFVDRSIASLKSKQKQLNDGSVSGTAGPNHKLSSQSNNNSLKLAMGASASASVRASDLQSQRPAAAIGGTSIINTTNTNTYTPTIDSDINPEISLRQSLYPIGGIGGLAI